jgi:hypothetical protein
MAKEDIPGEKQKAGKSQSPPTTAYVPKNGETGSIPSKSAGSRKSARSGNKGARTQIGGTAVPGAKSTQPKQVSNTNNPQQQEMESSNRMMRRRMERLGTGPQSSEPPKTIQERRKERKERVKERQQAQVSAVKRSLPGGRLSTNTNRVYYLIGGVAAAIVLLILVFVILHATGVLH